MIKLGHASHRTAQINKRVSEMWLLLADRREPAGGPEQAAKCSICFWT